jgi:beta-phosphoglucomutase-like phosphatase (HAD superfamily)
MRDTILYWTPNYATPEIVDMYERKLAANSNGVALAPGAADLHAVIPYERFGMYTGAKMRTAEARLKQCQLDRPKALFAGDTVSQGKPEPEG